MRFWSEDGLLIHLVLQDGFRQGIFALSAGSDGVSSLPGEVSPRWARQVYTGLCAYREKGDFLQPR